MRRYLLCLVVLCLSSYLYADEEEVLRTEYQQFQKILESAEENYWKKKYSLIEMKQAAKDELEGFDNEYDNLLKMRNSLKEEILSLKIDNKDLKDNIDNYKMRISEIYDSCINKLDSLRKFVKRYHPLTTEIDLIRINDIRKMIERKEDFIKIGHMILSFLNTKISDSRICMLEHADILTKDKVPKKGKRLRLGFSFYGYITDDDKDAGILLRTGKVTQNAFKWYEDVSSYKNTIMKTINSINGKEEFAYLPMDVMQSKAVGKSFATQGSFFRELLEWFKSGGVVMYAIVFVLIYALFIIVERIVTFRKNRLRVASLMPSLLQAIEKGDFDEALRICSERDGTLPRMLMEVFEDKNISREGAYKKMELVLLHEIPVIEKHLPTLKSLGALAPLLGLLGTVTGMISLFDVITAFGTGDPKLLAGGIAEALVTTEFGLIVAIPAILFHRMLLNFAEGIIKDIERFSLTLLNTGWESK